MEPIVDIAKLFAQGRLPKGNRVGVLSISGGSGIVYADAAMRGGMTLPPFSERRWPRCARSCPRSARPENPGRRHGRLLQRHARCSPIGAGDRAGRSRPRPALDPAGVDLRPRRRRAPARPSPRWRRHGQAGARGLVGPAREVARGGEGADRRRRAVPHHAGAAGAGRRRRSPASPPTSAACCRAGRRRSSRRRGSTCPPAPSR